MTVDDCKVVIEDKIFLPVNDEQLENYCAAVKKLGFMGMNWGSKTPQAVKNFRFTNKHFVYFYLQSEDNKICVKMNLDGGTFNNADVRHALETVRNYFRDKLGAAFEFLKFSFSRGKKISKWMTVGYMLYNEKNYRQQIQKVQQLFDSL